jgi:AcrR family transcriptional regulator
MPPVAPVTTPYKHLASKQALLAAIAARELARQRVALAETIQREPSPAAVLREAMHRYVAWALEYPARFKLTFGNWTIDSQELGEAAHDVLTMLVEIVAAAQDAGALPRATPSAWHHCYGRWPTGPPTWPPLDISPRTAKGHASADDLVDDLFDYLQDAAKATSQ